MNNNKFSFNKKYLTISVYALGVVFLSAILVKSIMDWENTKAAFERVFTTLSPFTSGIIIAYILYPLVAWFNRILEKFLHIHKKKLRKGISILLSYLTIFGILMFVLFIVIPQMIASLSALIAQVPDLYEDTLAFLKTLEEKYPEIDFSYFNNLFGTIAPQFLDMLKNLATNVLPLIYSTSISIVKALVNLFIAMIFSCYLLIDKERLFAAFSRIFSAYLSKVRLDSAKYHLNKCNKIFSSYVIGKTIDSLIIGIICYVGMLVLHLDYPLLISVLVGVTNIIPYFGPFIGAIPSGFILLLISPVQCVIFVIWILVLQQFDGMILGPKILGDSTGLRPLWIIFSISIGGSLAGVPGMFFGVPILGIIFYLGELFLKRREEKLLSGKKAQEVSVIPETTPGFIPKTTLESVPETEDRS